MKVYDTELLIELAKFMMPVGFIVRLKVATNPATVYGFGTWELHGAGRVGVCIDPTQTEFDTLGKTGGAKTHTLTTSEMPSHTHQETVQDGQALAKYSTTGSSPTLVWTESTGNSGTPLVTIPTGGGTAHNNLQPYIVEYVWARTA